MAEPAQKRQKPIVTIITLQSIPTDCLLSVGAYLQRVRSSNVNDIDQITLAGILSNYDMLEHFLLRNGWHKLLVSVVLSGNTKAMK